MISKSQIKLFTSLQHKKFRDKEQLYLIEGFRLVMEAVTSQTSIQQIWLTDDFSNTENGKFLLNFCAEYNIQTESASTKELDKVCDSKHNQGVIALLPLPALANTIPVKIQSPILILDDISDPGNMGTLLRTASWYGVKNIILSPGCVDVFNPKVVRSGMGAHFYTKQMFQLPLLDAIKPLKQLGVAFLGADMEGTPIYSFEPPEKYALILGNEAHGISPEILPHLTERVTIPKQGYGESLNVASAGAVIMDRLTKPK